MNKEDFKTHSCFKCLLTELLTYWSLSQSRRYIYINYVTNKKFLCINSHNYIYYFFVIFLHSTVSKIAALTLCKILARLHFLLQFLLQFPDVPPLHFLGLHHCNNEWL